MPTRNWRTVGIGATRRFSEMSPPSLRDAAIRHHCVATSAAQRFVLTSTPVFGRNAQIGAIPIPLYLASDEDEATYYEGGAGRRRRQDRRSPARKGISSTQSDRCFRTLATWAAVTGGAELPQFARTKVASLAMSASP